MARFYSIASYNMSYLFLVLLPLQAFDFFSSRDWCVPSPPLPPLLPSSELQCWRKIAGLTTEVPSTLPLSLVASPPPSELVQVSSHTQHWLVNVNVSLTVRGRAAVCGRNSSQISIKYNFYISSTEIFKITRLMKWSVESGSIGFLNLEQQIPILDMKFEELQSFHNFKLK